MKRNYRLLVVIFFISVLRSEAQQIPDYLNCVKINQLAREACHNCYQKGDPNLPSISSALDLTRVIELDIHSHKHGGNETIRRR